MFFSFIFLARSAVFLAKRTFYLRAEWSAESPDQPVKIDEDAIIEMVGGGFGFRRTWSNLASWIDKLDIDKIRREAGVASTQPR